MLLPSIITMLDQNQAQLKTAEHARTQPAQPEHSSSLKKIELEIAAAAELVKPSEAVQPPAAKPSPAGPFLEELLRAITKFEKTEPSRVVDVFE